MNSTQSSSTVRVQFSRQSINDPILGSNCFFRGSFKNIKQKLKVSILSCLGCFVVGVSTGVAGGIKEDFKAPDNQQPMVIKTSSGVIQVNVRAPTAGGVSMNQYTQFDVDGKGVVLGNNPSAARTRIAGWVEANPHMARGGADVIVNQVNSTNPSHLNGYIEVAGKRADVIIANPSGISVNGGGFLNTNRAVLSTGQTRVKNGQLTGYDIDRGQISITGQGLDVRDSNYTALLARTAKINANIHQDKGHLDVITGLNQVAADIEVLSSDKSSKSGDKPTVSIDTGNLSGMYAGSIRLIGTESGVGVNNAGIIQTNKLTLSADGKLVNIGKVKSRRLDISATSLDNKGSLEQSGQSVLNVNSSRLFNSGNIGFSKPSGNQSNQPHSPNTETPKPQPPASGLTPSGVIVVSGELHNSGDINSAGGVNALSSKELNNTGKMKLGSAQLDSGRLDNSGDLVISDAKLSGGDLENTGVIHATKVTSFNFSEMINNKGRLEFSDEVNWNTKSVDNQGEILIDNALSVVSDKLKNTGKISAFKGLTVDAKKIENNSQIISNDKLKLSGNTIDNSGHIQGKLIDVSSGGSVNNAETGQLTSLSALSITSSSVRNEGVIKSDNDLTIKSTSLDNVGGTMVSGNSLDVTVQDTLSNIQKVDKKGRILSKGSLSLQSQSLDNQSVISSNKNLNLTGKTLSNTGELSASKDVIISGNELKNTGGVISAGESLKFNYADGTVLNQANAKDKKGTLVGKHTEINAKTLFNKDGIVSADSELVFKGDSLTNESGKLLGKTLNIVASNKLTNTQGEISAERVHITAKDLNNVKGDIKSNDLTELSVSHNLINTQGNILSNTQVSILGVAFSGASQSPSDLTLKVKNEGGKLAARILKIFTNALVNDAQGQLKGGEKLELSSQSLNNTGLMNSGGLTSLSIDRNLDNRGRIYGTEIRLNSEYLKNASTAAIAARRALKIGSKFIHNALHAKLYSGGELLIGGLVDSKGELKKRAKQLINQGGSIESIGTMTLNIDRIENNNANFRLEKQLVTGSEKLFDLVKSKEGTQKYQRSDFVEVNPYTEKPLSFFTTDVPISEMIKKSTVFQLAMTADQMKSFYLGLKSHACNRNDVCELRYGDASILGKRGIFSPWQIGPNKSTFGMYKSRIIRQYAYPIDHPIWAYFGMDKPKGYTQYAKEYRQEHYQLWTEIEDSKIESEYVLYRKAVNDVLSAKVENYNKNFKEFSLGNDWLEYKGTQKDYIDRVVSSAPGRIVSGGDLNLSSDKLINDKSEIIVGASLVGDENNIEQVDVHAKKYREKIGQSRQRTYYDNGKFAFWHKSRRGYTKWVAYEDKTSSDISLAVSKFEQGKHDSGTGPSPIQYSKDGKVKTSTTSNIILPNNQLFNVDGKQTDALVNIDPEFAGPSSLSSDYLLKQVMPKAPDAKSNTQNPFADKLNLHKRIGDGYYERRLIQDQITKLTGYRYLPGHHNDLHQFKSLMNNGVKFAKKHSLRPGIALTPEQMGALTEDLVWMVNEKVTLPNGAVQTVLVPKVYTKVRKGDITEGGSLITASLINLSKTDIDNSGSIAGRYVTKIKGDNVTNRGRLYGGRLHLDAKEDINNIGGSITADELIHLKATNINSISTTIDSKTGSHKRTDINRIASIGTLGEGASLILDAKNDIDLSGSVISSAGKKIQEEPESMDGLQSDSSKKKTKYKNGVVLIKAGHDVKFGTVDTQYEEETAYDPRNKYSETRKHAVGTSINTGSADIVVSAGNKVKMKGSEVNSSLASVSMFGENGVTIENSESTLDSKSDSYEKTRNIFGSKSHEQHHTTHQTTVNSSSVTGKRITITTGKKGDINVKGSNVISDEATLLKAGGNVTITAAKNKYSSTHVEQNKKSGLFSSGGLGFTIGKQKQSTDTHTEDVIHTGSQVGNLKEGNTTIVAGNKYTQTGSTVNSVKGDVGITAKQIDVSSVVDTTSMDTVQKFEQSGLTVSVSVPMMDTMNGLSGASNTLGQSKNSRVNAMAAANTAYKGYQATQALKNMNPSDAMGGASLSVSLGNQKSRNEQHVSTSKAQGSKITAGGKVSLIATGGNNSSIKITGSDVVGDKETSLFADHNVDIVAAEEISTERSSNKSSGGSLGVSVSSSGVGVTASANQAKGYGKGNSTTYRHSHVGSRDSKTTITAGNKLSLIGGQVLGDGVKVRAKDLLVRSVQNTSSYKSRQESMGGSLTVGTSVSGSANYNRSKVNANHRSVGEQSGILAGDEGFDVRVTNHTELDGGVITSTLKAEENGKNSFDTGTLSVADIDNVSKYDGSATGISLSGGMQQSSSSSSNGSDGNAVNMSKSIGYGKDNERSSSQTVSGIGTKNIKVRRGTFSEEVITDRTTNDVLADKGLSNIFDKDEVQKELDLQVSVTQSFDETRQGTRQMISEKIDALKEQGASKEDIAKWESANRILDGLSSALYTPNSTGVLGDTAQIAAPHIAKEIGDHFAEKGTTGSASHGLAHTILASAVAAAGGNDGLTAGLSAGGSEMAAPVVANYLYGTSDPDKLTAEQKNTVSNITSTLGTAAGVSTGNATDVVASTNAAKNAVDNNYLSRHEDKHLSELKGLYAQCQAQGGNCEKLHSEIKEIEATDKERDKQIDEACLIKESPECRSAVKQAYEFHKDYLGDPSLTDNRKKLISKVLSYGDPDDSVVTHYIVAGFDTGKESLTGITDTATAIAGSIVGHQESEERLGEIVHNSVEFAKSPIDSTFKSIYDARELIADLRAVGYNNAADKLQAKFNVGGGMTILGFTALSKAIANRALKSKNGGAGLHAKYSAILDKLKQPSTDKPWSPIPEMKFDEVASVPAATTVSRTPDGVAPNSNTREFDQIAREGQTRQQQMLDDNRGYNISRADAEKYPEMGNPNPKKNDGYPDGGQTFLTDKRVFEENLGELPNDGGVISVTQRQADKLASDIGMDRGELGTGSTLRQVENIKDLSPSSPTRVEDPLFRGPGQHLPSGAPEINVNPAQPKVNNPNVTNEWVLEVGE